MDEEHRKSIQEIIGGMTCPKDFECCESDFANVCKAKDFGVEKFLKCLEENPRKCEFSMSFGYAFFCQCPLRVYIAKKLNK